MQLPRQVTGPLCRHPAHRLAGPAWLKVGRVGKGRKAGRKGEPPRDRRPTEQRRDCGGGRPGAARLPGKTGRRDFSVCTIKEKGEKKKNTAPSQTPSDFTHARPSSSVGPVPRTPEQKANQPARRRPPKLGVHRGAPRRPPPPGPPPGPPSPGPPPPGSSRPPIPASPP